MIWCGAVFFFFFFLFWFLRKWILFYDLRLTNTLRVDVDFDFLRGRLFVCFIFVYITLLADFED